MKFSSVGEDRKFVLNDDMVGLSFEQSSVGSIIDLFIDEDPHDRHTRINYKYTFENGSNRVARHSFIETTAPVTVATYEEI